MSHLGTYASRCHALERRGLSVDLTANLITTGDHVLLAGMERLTDDELADLNRVARVAGRAMRELADGEVGA